MDHIEQRILSIIDDHANELNALAEDLFHHAEAGYHEYRTARIVSDHLKQLGLSPREGLAITGVKASIGSGAGPNIALIGELDGLSCPAHPNASNGYAHACGHYAQIICMLGAALALSDPEVAASLDGTATIFAVPAEEFLGVDIRREVRRTHDIRCAGGKCELLRRGEFDDIDLAITTHSFMSDRDCGADLMLGTNNCTGFIGKTISIRGRASHAGISPHLGINAQNAACLGMSALGMIRETFEEKHHVRIQALIRESKEALNVVPDHITVDCVVRASTQEAIEAVSAKVDNCFKGAALSIGCDIEIVDSLGYMPCPERQPEQVMWDAAALLGDDVKVAPIPTGLCNTASTDVGDLFAIMPVLNFTFGGSVGALHTVDYKVTNPYTAHVLPAKMMALLAYRLLKDGAAEARKVMADYKAPYTLNEYKEYVRGLTE